LRIILHFSGALVNDFTFALYVLSFYLSFYGLTLCFMFLLYTFCEEICNCVPIARGLYQQVIQPPPFMVCQQAGGSYLELRHLLLEVFCALRGDVDFVQGSLPFWAARVRQE
jgi:hypothetical protein